MEKWLTIDEYMDTFLGFLTFVASLGGLFFLWKGYVLAQDYLDQHEKKVTVERRRIAAENGLRALIKMDQVMFQFFSMVSLAGTAEYSQVKQLSVTRSKKFEFSYQKIAQKLIFTTMVFRWNFRKLHNSLSDFHKELKLNGMLIKDLEFEHLEHEFDLTINAITDMMLFQWDREFKSVFSIEKLEEFRLKMPLLFDDKSKPIISDYDEKGEELRQFFLKYC